MEEAIFTPYCIGSRPIWRNFFTNAGKPGILSSVLNAAASSGWIKSDELIINHVAKSLGFTIFLVIELVYSIWSRHLV